MQHLYNNFKKANSGGDLRHILWACARASNPRWWKKRMQQLKVMDVKAHMWLLSHARSPRRWNKAFFPLIVKTDMLCNNLSESFNSFILKAREKSIITMLETIRKKLMKRIRDRKIAMERKTCPVYPRIMKILDENFKLSDGMEVEWNWGRGGGRDSFKVQTYGRQYVVDCKAKECTCRLWQLTGIHVHMLYTVYLNYNNFQ
ncbi:hypothetical protein LIER_25048 [Lithospermum erythrorhizon]|uniref:SWIM-type domain-containing protein n=1 Tax=Lithospermum erythrorhizon TaxID=34254 RepID=A0AAV3R6C0_LITER